MRARFGAVRNQLWVAAALALLFASSPLMAQSAGPSPEELERWYTGSEVVDVETEDGVYLKVRYWAPAKPGKDTPVVILIHNLKRSSVDWAPLAQQLFESGFAVVTFDFRGHGESTRVNPDVYEPVNPKRGQRAPSSISHAEEFRREKDAMVLVNDLDRVKRFILEKNNSGSINAHRLGIITAGGFSGLLALEFAKQEYEVGESDLNALVMFVPEARVGGMSVPSDFDKTAAAEDKLPILVISGPRANLSNFTRSLKIATRDDVTKLKERYPNHPSDWWLEGKMRREAVWLTFDTKVPFSQMIQNNTDNLNGIVAGYLTARLTGDEKKGLTWTTRETVNKKPGGTFGSNR